VEDENSEDVKALKKDLDDNIKLHVGEGAHGNADGLLIDVLYDAFAPDPDSLTPMFELMGTIQGTNQQCRRNLTTTIPTRSRISVLVAPR